MNRSQKVSVPLLTRSVKDKHIPWDTCAFLIVVSLAAFLLRCLNFSYESADYRFFLLQWYEQIDAAGGLLGIGKVYGNYTSTYMYLMALMTYLPVSPLVAIKLFSVVFDYLLAVYVALLVRHMTGKDTSAVVAYTAVLFLPHVFLNSALWAQCDALFTTFLVMSLYYLLKGRSAASMISFGLSFSFKLQAVFFLPIVILALCGRKIKWWSPFWAVGVFLLSGLPAIVAGMSPLDAYGVYFEQAGYYAQLNMNAPNLYAAVQRLATYAPYDHFADSLVLFAFGAIGCAMYPMYRAIRSFDDDSWVLAALFFAAFMPFVLPHMHERYWFVSDILALVWVICRPREWLASLCLLLPSLYALSIYLFQVDHTVLPYFAILMLVGICLVSKRLWEHLHKPSNPESPTIAT